MIGIYLILLNAHHCVLSASFFIESTLSIRLIKDLIIIIYDTYLFLLGIDRTLKQKYAALLEAHQVIFSDNSSYKNIYLNA